MTSVNNSSKSLQVFLWIAQVILFLGLLLGAATKLLLPIDALAEMFPWAGDNPLLVKITGVLDLLAGIGLLLPTLLRIKAKLTVYAAVGTIALMIAASLFHIARGEHEIEINVFFAVLAVFIAWGRLKKSPIQPK